MPWKGEKDPYKIWLSEIILQQTRVEQGWNYYNKFIEAFPTIRHLARAPEKKIFKMWEGLGYYTRCKNLIATARKISDEYKGVFPSTYNEIKQLKGIGPYTAAAISSFAFNEPQAVVDGNVQRVISRYFGITTPIDTAEGKKQYQQLAQQLLHVRQPGIYNQAIMDFGAVICKPQNPLCKECIQKNECKAVKENLVKQLPVKAKSLVKKERWLYYFVLQVDDKVYLRKRTGRDIWENLHEFILMETKGPQEDEPAKLLWLKKLMGRQNFRVMNTSRVFSQQLTHQVIHGQFITVSTNKPVTGLKDYRLTPRSQLKKHAFPRLINTFLNEKTTQAALF